MMQDDLINEYFEWMCDIVNHSDDTSKLLAHLHRVDFTYTIPMDGNRYEDGIALRYHFGDEFGYDPRIIARYLDVKPCSVLEMMVALALRCEEHIMSDWEQDDRTYQWFDLMLKNIGLGDMTNYNYNPRIVDHSLDIMLNRKYRRDGSNGGLFIVENPRQDLRSVDIWYQMNWYLNTII